MADRCFRVCEISYGGTYIIRIAISRKVVVNVDEVRGGHQLHSSVCVRVELLKMGGQL